MSRWKKIMYEGAGILLIGLVTALCITVLWNYTHRPTLQSFLREYGGGDVSQQEAVAEKYLKLFPAADLLQAIERQNVGSVCHIQGHAIGRALFKTNPNFDAVLKQCGNSCTYGCFHGALMQMFSTESDNFGGVIEDDTPAAYLDRLVSLAPDLCTRPEVASVVTERHCTHGLGHVMENATGYNIENAIRLCHILHKTHEISSCVNGVFMEYVFSATSTTISEQKSIAPCDQFPDYTQQCYRYKAFDWIAAWGGVTPALAACDSMGAHTMTCILSVAEAGATGPTAKLLEKQEGFETLCGSLTGEKRKMCIAGALLMAIEFYSDDVSDNVCKRVASVYEKPCLDLLHEYVGQFTHDR